MSILSPFRKVSAPSDGRVGFISQDVRVAQEDACFLFHDHSECSVRCRWLFPEISVMNMDYACSLWHGLPGCSGC